MKSKRIKLPNTLDIHPATSHQKEYAQSLGITIPINATKSDAKALIDRYFDEDIASPKSLITYAMDHEILCSSYIGYKFLHNLMFDNLSPLDLSAFFCYCVYQDMMQDYHQNLDEHLYCKVFYDFSKLYHKDFYFITSLQDYYGEDLLTFGKNTVSLPNGSKQTLYGGSKQTKAYQLAFAYLTETLNLSSLPKQNVSSSTLSFWQKIFTKKK